MLHMFLFNCQRFASKQVHQNIIRMLLLCSFLQTFTNWPMLVCQLSLSSCGVWWHSSKREKILGWDYRCNIHLWLNFTNKWIGFDDKICKHYSRTKGQQAIKHHSIVQKISLPLPQWVSPYPSEILVSACTFIQTFTGPALQFPIALLVAGMDIFWSTFVSIIFSNNYKYRYYFHNKIKTKINVNFRQTFTNYLR